MRKDTNNSYLESIHQAIAYIENNLALDIQLEEIAKHTNLSPFHFHRIFKSLTGNTTKEYITRLRLEKAALQLKHSPDSIGQIAFNCGYQHHETFTRAFKDYFDMTPVEYRNAISVITRNKQAEYNTANTDLQSLNVKGPIIKTIPDLHVAYIRHTGSYDQVGASFQRLMLWAASHLVLKLMPATIGIVHDNPDNTAVPHIRFDACVVLSKAINPRGEIGYKKIDGGKFAVFTYKGSYEGFYPVYDYIYNVCLFEKKFNLADQPAMEWYIQSPPFYKPANYVTDFYLPIQ